MVKEEEARDIALTIRREIELAVDVVLSAAEKCLNRLGAARDGDVDAVDHIEQLLCTILEACSFQDITGQRLAKLEQMLVDLPVKAVAGDPLLNGPAPTGQGLDQTAADRLLGANGATGPDGHL
ncbi:MAG: hypothetical protein ACOH1H_07135 [Brevundimonas sp.]|jgi:hypothetical protein